jgi:teichuronic acid biosynthesis glycosyltransferase TuaH
MSLLRSFSRIPTFVREKGVAALVRFVLHRLLHPSLGRLFHNRIVGALAEWRSQNPAPREIILLATMDWAYPYRQRQQHLAKALSEAGERVVYVTPSNGHDRLWTIRPLNDKLCLASSLEAALEREVEKSYRSVLMLLSVDTRWQQRHLETLYAHKGLVLYDYLDALEDALSTAAITPERRRLHETLLKDESRVAVACVAEVLEDDVARHRQSCYALVRNGVDAAPFLRAKRGEPLRADMEAIVARQNPIIGYYGSLAAWLDCDLLKTLARERPDYEIVLIGPDLDGTALRFHDVPPNLNILPGMDYTDLPRHAIWFDVGLIPFVLNAITRATSPLKLYEYLALGLPVVSSPMPECRRQNGVWIGETPADFIAKVDTALALRDDPQHKQRCVLEAQNQSWTARAAQMRIMLDSFSL